jgi:hypothetical protein
VAEFGEAKEGVTSFESSIKPLIVKSATRNTNMTGLPVRAYKATSVATKKPIVLTTGLLTFSVDIGQISVFIMEPPINIIFQAAF